MPNGQLLFFHYIFFVTLRSHYSHKGTTQIWPNSLFHIGFTWPSDSPVPIPAHLPTTNRMLCFLYVCCDECSFSISAASRPRRRPQFFTFLSRRRHRRHPPPSPPLPRACSTSAGRTTHLARRAPGLDPTTRTLPAFPTRPPKEGSAGAAATATTEGDMIIMPNQTKFEQFGRCTFPCVAP